MSQGNITDGTCLLIMNPASCYRLPLRKYYNHLIFLNYFVQTLSHGLLGVYIQDGGHRPCRVVHRLACRHLGFVMYVDPGQEFDPFPISRNLHLDMEGLVYNKMHRLCREDLERAL